MKARLITRFKDVTPEGGVIEWVVWRVPEPVAPSGHGFKYRAAYAISGVRVVGFDNERGKATTATSGASSEATTSARSNN